MPVTTANVRNVSRATAQGAAIAVQPTPAQTVSFNGDAAGKKRKKRKGKGRGVVDPTIAHAQDEYSDDESHRGSNPDSPEAALGNEHFPYSLPGARTGLSPDLASVHFSSTASLAAAAAGKAPPASVEFYEEMYRTANVNLDFDVADVEVESATLRLPLPFPMPGTGQGTRPQSDHHNASWPVDVDFGMLPAHIRQFVESAWAGLSGLSAKDMKAQVLAAMAQSEELHAAGKRCTNGNCVHSTAQGLPAMPALDPKARALTEKVFAEVLEKIVAAKDEGHTTPGGMVLTGEFAIDEHGVVNGHHHGPDVRLYAEFTSDEEEDGVGDGLDGGGDGVNYDDEGLLGMPGTYTALNGATYISAGEKPRKSRKKKKKKRKGEKKKK